MNEGPYLPPYVRKRVQAYGWTVAEAIAVPKGQGRNYKPARRGGRGTCSVCEAATHNRQTCPVRRARLHEASLSRVVRPVPESNRATR